MDMLLEGWKQPKIAQGEIEGVQRMKWQFNIDVIEVFLYQWGSMETRIILVQDPLVFQFWEFPINMPPEDLRDFEVIFLVGGRLWWHKVLMKRALMVKEHN